MTYSSSIWPLSSSPGQGIRWDWSAGIPGAVGRGLAGLPALYHSVGAETAGNYATPGTAGAAMNYTQMLGGAPESGALNAGSALAAAGKVGKNPGAALADAVSAGKANLKGGQSLVRFNPDTRSWELAPGVQGPPQMASPLANGGRGAGLPPVAQEDLPRYIPAKGVPQRTLDITSNPDVRQRMLDSIRTGMGMSGSNWYDTTSLRQAFHDLNGPEQGEEDFRNFMKYVGTNSPQNKVPPNIKQASYYYYLDKNGIPIPTARDAVNPNIPVKGDIPSPYSALPAHQFGSAEVQAGTRDPMGAMKTSSFAQNLSGNYDPVTIDLHALKAPAMFAQDPRWLTADAKKAFNKGDLTMADALKDPSLWESSPGANEYAHLENWWKGLAQEAGITPAQAQASSWVANGQMTGLGTDESKTFIDMMNDRANITAQKTGVGDAQSQLQAFIRGQQPLLSAPAAASIPFSALSAQTPGAGLLSGRVDPNSWLRPGELGL